MTNIKLKNKWGSMRARASPLAALGNSFRIRRGRAQEDHVDRSPMRATVSFPLAALGNTFGNRRGRPRDDRADSSRGSGCTREQGCEERREDEQTPQECGYEYFYEEEACRNIFDEPLIVKRRKRRRRLARRPAEPSDVSTSATAEHCVENSEEILPNSSLEVASMLDDLSATTPQPEDPSDVSASVIAQHCAEKSEEVLPNSSLEVASMPDDLSTVTPYMFFRDCSSVSTLMIGQVDMGMGSDALDSKPSGPSGDSHVANDLVEAVPSQDMGGHHLESFAPNLATLRAVVEQCIQAGEEADAIDIVTQVLIIDNARSMSEDTALFCLTTLEDLAQTDENTHRVISEGTAVNAVVEAMQLYHGQSSEVHMRACEVLWCLTLYDPQ